MAASGDERFSQDDEAGNTAAELAEASAEDVAPDATSTSSDLAGTASTCAGESTRDVEGNGGPSDGAARPSKAATDTSEASSSGEAARFISAAAAAPTMKARIAMLREEQKQLRATNKAKTREIRNAERRCKRLKEKVGSLTDEDLVEVLRSRAEAKTGTTQPTDRRALLPSGEESRSPPLKRPATSLKE